MRSLALIPAALIAIQVQATTPIKLNIEQWNRNAYLRVFELPKKGEKVTATLLITIAADAGKDGIWTDAVDFPEGSSLVGECPQDRAFTFNAVILPNGDRVEIAPFTVSFKPGDVARTKSVKN